MKKQNALIILSFLLCLCTFFSSCKKDVLPKIELTSVTLYSLDSVLLTGQKATNGTGKITNIGFEYSDNASFNSSKKVFIYNSQTTFTAVVPATHNKTYYFRAIVENDNNQGSSNVIVYTVPLPPPATAPCTLANNFVIGNPASYGVSVYANPGSPSGHYEVDFLGQNQDINIYFSGAPHNGIYTTIGDPSNFIVDGQVALVVTGFINGIVNTNQNVYVALSDSGKTTISFCSLLYTIPTVGSTTISGKGTY